MTFDTRFDFDRDGCLLVRNALGPRELDPLIQHIDQEIGRFADDLKRKGEIEDTFAALPFERRLVALGRESESRLRSWNNIALCQGLYDVICHPTITELLKPILGRDFGFNGDYHLRPKLPNSRYTAFPWHQDSQYYGRESQYARIITVWIPLVDVDQQNGCLQVLPGSWEWGLLHGARGADQNMRTAENVEQRGTPVPLPMRKGDILLFSNLTFHQSTLNLTDAVRWSVDIRYARIIEKHDLAPEVLASETFMRQKLDKFRRVPIALEGASKRCSYQEWRTALAS